MRGVQFQCLLVVLVGLLELVEAEVPDGEVVAGLEGGFFAVCLLGVVDGGVQIFLVGLDDGKIVEGFDVVGPLLEGVLVGFGCEVELTEHGVDIPDVVPKIGVGEGIVLVVSNGSLETRVEEMILMIGKAAQPHIIPQLKRLIAKLDQPLIELNRNFRLIFIKKVRGDIGDGLNIAILNGKCSFIELMCLF
jgi:hypothetical protein